MLIDFVRRWAEEREDDEGPSDLVSSVAEQLLALGHVDDLHAFFPVAEEIAEGTLAYDDAVKAALAGERLVPIAERRPSPAEHASLAKQLAEDKKKSVTARARGFAARRFDGASYGCARRRRDGRDRQPVRTVVTYEAPSMSAPRGRPFRVFLLVLRGRQARARRARRCPSPSRACPRCIPARVMASPALYDGASFEASASRKRPRRASHEKSPHSRYFRNSSLTYVGRGQPPYAAPSATGARRRGSRERSNAAMALPTFT